MCRVNQRCACSGAHVTSFEKHCLYSPLGLSVSRKIYNALVCAGHDISVCIALALLLVCFTSETGQGQSFRFKSAYSPTAAESSAEAGMDRDSRESGQQLGCGLARPEFGTSRAESSEEMRSTARKVSSCGRAVTSKGIGVQDKQRQHDGKQSEAASKDDIRRALAFVSACYPHARPSRGSLRQVYNFLLQTEQQGFMDLKLNRM